MSVVIAPGTTVSIKPYASSGGASVITNLIGFSGSGLSVKMIDTTGILDTIETQKPVRPNLGTVTLTLMLADTAPATNQLTVFRNMAFNKLMQTLIVNLPGAFDDSTGLITADGYVSRVSQPDISTSTGVLTYTVEFALTP
jgi:hypothetical protein